MTTIDLQTAFRTACAELGLDPANTNLFTLECRRQGREPSTTSMADLDRNASALWAEMRKPKIAV